MQVSAITTAVQGFNSASQKLNSDASQIAGGQSDPTQPLVDTQLASASAQGDLSVIKTQDNMFQSLINIIA